MGGTARPPIHRHGSHCIIPKNLHIDTYYRVKHGPNAPSIWIIGLVEYSRIVKQILDDLKLQSQYSESPALYYFVTSACLLVLMKVTGERTNYIWHTTLDTPSPFLWGHHELI